MVIAYFTEEHSRRVRPGLAQDRILCYFEGAMKKIIVIGGGAAGMMAAVSAAKTGAAVMLLEKNEKLGKKIYITGKGRCNLTNDCDRESFFAHLLHNPRFLYSSFAAFDNAAMMTLLEENGLALKTERGNRVFPVSDKASDVTKTLTALLAKYRVKVRLNTEVKELILEEVPTSDKKTPKLCCTGAMTDKEPIPADAVIVATGGLSYPTTGSTGDGYRFAKAAGHKVTALYPALVPFNAKLSCGIPVESLQGLSLKNIEIRVTRPEGGKILYREFGEMLFTHFGVSGPVILHLSSVVTEQIAKGPLRLQIDLKPALSDEQLEARLQREFEAAPNKTLSVVMRKLLPAALVEPVLAEQKLAGNMAVNRAGRDIRIRIIRALRSLELELTSPRGYGEAVVTQGGVNVKEIDPKTMASKLVQNLYFAGEVLDLDGYTGGFNLQIAWTTGAAAGKAAALSSCAKHTEMKDPSKREQEKTNTEQLSPDTGKDIKMKNSSIAIDGPAGAGKSTIAKALAKELGMIYVDTGAMYRAMAVFFLRKGLSGDDEAGICAACEDAQVEIRYEDGQQQVILNGENVTGLLRTEEVGSMASASSVYGPVRSRMVALQQELARKTPVVMDGRDIGTVVLPDAKLKIYLTASVKERARRRANELREKGEDVDIAVIEHDIEERDFRDKNRPIGPLKQAEDAHLVDSSDMGIQEVIDTIRRLYEG